jgi:hypothetical protein
MPRCKFGPPLLYVAPETGTSSFRDAMPEGFDQRLLLVVSAFNFIVNRDT